MFSPLLKRINTPNAVSDKDKLKPIERAKTENILERELIINNTNSSPHGRGKHTLSTLFHQSRKSFTSHNITSSSPSVEMGSSHPDTDFKRESQISENSHRSEASFGLQPPNCSQRSTQVGKIISPIKDDQIPLSSERQVLIGQDNKNLTFTNIRQQESLWAQKVSPTVIQQRSTYIYIYILIGVSVQRNLSPISISSNKFRVKEKKTGKKYKIIEFKNLIKSPNK